MQRYAGKIFFEYETGRVRAGWRILLTTMMIVLLLIVSSIFFSGQVAFTTAMAVIVLVVLWISAKIWDKRPFSEFGFAINKTWLRDFAVGNGIAIAAMSAVFGILIATGNAHVSGSEAGISCEWILSLVSVLWLMLAVSIWEELYFRGYLVKNLEEGFTYPCLKRYGPVVVAVLGSSALFGFAHASNPNSQWISVINISVAGIVLAYPYIKTGSIAFPVGMHLSWNYFQGAVYGFPVSSLDMDATFLNTDVTGPELFTGGAFGPEGGLIGFIGIILMALLCSFFLKLFYNKY